MKNENEMRLKKNSDRYGSLYSWPVPGTRLELAQIAPYAPQTYVYTNFTTRA